MSLDSVANDGSAGEGDNVGADVEDVFSSGTGPDTIAGRAASNTLQGSGGDDQIDGGAGNDTLSASAGNDTIRARDGFSDRVACDAGSADVAVVDTLATVVGCETVHRADVGNANDVPEDRPPRDRDPVARPQRADRGDRRERRDRRARRRGVASVQLSTTARSAAATLAAPFAIPFRPKDGDVGSNTIVAIATDTAGQTTTAIRALRVARFRPRRLSLRVAPSRDRRAPFRFRATAPFRCRRG